MLIASSVRPDRKVELPAQHVATFGIEGGSQFVIEVCTLDILDALNEGVFVAGAAIQE